MRQILILFVTLCKINCFCKQRGEATGLIYILTEHCQEDGSSLSHHGLKLEILSARAFQSALTLFGTVWLVLGVREGVVERYFYLLVFTLVKIDSNTIFNLADFPPFQKVGNDKRILDLGKKANLGEGILHKCKFHGKLCTYYFSYAQFADILLRGTFSALISKF